MYLDVGIKLEIVSKYFAQNASIIFSFKILQKNKVFARPYISLTLEFVKHITESFYQNHSNCTN